MLEEIDQQTNLQIFTQRPLTIPTLHDDSLPQLGESPNSQPTPPPTANPFSTLNLPAIPFPFVDPLQMRLEDNLRAIKGKIRDCIFVPLDTLANHDRYTKIPACLAMVTAVHDAQLITLSDGTVEVEACVHGKVQPKPHRGMVMHLEQISLFAPSDRYRCLIICPQNIVTVYLNQFNT